MRNSFNIEVNFANSPLKPYEWEEVSFINGIKVLRVSPKCIHDILSREVKIDYASKLILLSDTRDSIVVKLDSKGKVVKRSFLLFDKDLDVCEFANSLRVTKLEYEVSDKKVKYSLELLEEKKIKEYLIDTIKSSPDEDKTQYLYYLYFNDIKGYSKEKLINSIKNEASERYFELYKFLIKN